MSGGILPPLAVEYARALPREFDEQPDEHMPQHFAGIRVGMGVLVVKPPDLEINPAVRVDQVQQIVAERLLRPEIRAEDRKEAVVVVEPGEVVFDRFLQEQDVAEFNRPVEREVGQVVRMVQADEAGTERILPVVDLQQAGSVDDVQNFPELPPVQRLRRVEVGGRMDVVLHDDRQIVLEIIRRAVESARNVCHGIIICRRVSLFQSAFMVNRQNFRLYAELCSNTQSGRELL